MFELSIKSSKDVSKLQIDFADGTSTVSTSVPTQPSHTPQVKSTQDKGTGSRDVFLNTDDDDYGPISQEVVQLPKISDIVRPVNVAIELQNLDF